MSSPSELTLELRPRARVDIIDVSQRIAEEFGDLLAEHRRAIYCSLHTTAGYFEQSLCSRLHHNRDHVDRFVRVFQRLFPQAVDYRHDQLDLRTELSDEQRATEPKNADSHLTFIGSGLRNCVTYVNRPDTPVYFVDLDGINDETRTARRRRTTILAFDNEVEVASARLEIPAGSHTVDSINLRDPELGLFEQVAEMISAAGVEKGRIDVQLDSDERHAGLTVNEYETLLMRHDLADVLRDPLRHVAAKGRGMLRNPLAIPGKTLNYAQYDLVRMLNEMLDAVGANESIVERMVARLAGPASRFLRLKRSLSLLVSENGSDGPIVQGTYQSPILVQWRKPDGGARRLRVTLTRFE